jgi:hypothetical protein
MEKAKDWATSGGQKWPKIAFFKNVPFASRIILGSLWSHFGVILDSFGVQRVILGSFGVVWGSFCGQIGVLLSHFGVILGSFSDHFRVILGSFWTHLGSFWNHFGVILGPFWDHFGSLYRKKDPKTTQNDPYQNNKKNWPESGNPTPTNSREVPTFPWSPSGNPLRDNRKVYNHGPGRKCLAEKARQWIWGTPRPLPPYFLYCYRPGFF